MTPTALETLRDDPYQLLVSLQARLSPGGQSDGMRDRVVWSGLLFDLGDNRWVAAREDVAEVLEVPAWTRIPCTQLWMLGLTNLRGEVLPVVDLGRFMGHERALLSKHSRLLVYADPALRCGLLVDRVRGLHDFAPQDQRHQQIDADPHAADNPHVLGGFAAAGQLCRVLSLRKLTRDPAFRDVGI